ncbi:hypothetical protein A4S02_14240 (plasmid) [Acetobacter ascendens]|uniref:Uncharacterized protein n=1 Tax=Acetobacter ascendens TaxID=481146 RepID=A0A1D8R080_9PROT|nr:hypothetical protein A4S02_14240 [Acetobacter ascendens]
MAASCAENLTLSTCYFLAPSQLVHFTAVIVRRAPVLPRPDRHHPALPTWSQSAFSLTCQKNVFTKSGFVNT